MIRLREIAKILFSLFVDDGVLAAAALAWTAFAGFALPLALRSDAARAALLFCGLAVLLVLSAWLRAGRGRLPR